MALARWIGTLCDHASPEASVRVMYLLRFFLLAPLDLLLFQIDPRGTRAMSRPGTTLLSFFLLGHKTCPTATMVILSTICSFTCSSLSFFFSLDQRAGSSLLAHAGSRRGATSMGGRPVTSWIAKFLCCRGLPPHQRGLRRMSSK